LSSEEERIEQWLPEPGKGLEDRGMKKEWLRDSKVQVARRNNFCLEAQ
jgi:hypothetical protein